MGSGTCFVQWRRSQYPLRKSTRSTYRTENQLLKSAPWTLRGFILIVFLKELTDTVWRNSLFIFSVFWSESTPISVSVRGASLIPNITFLSGPQHLHHICGHLPSRVRQVWSSISYRCILSISVAGAIFFLFAWVAFTYQFAHMHTHAYETGGLIWKHHFMVKRGTSLRLFWLSFFSVFACRWRWAI